jgi:beta-galactosidase
MIMKFLSRRSPLVALCLLLSTAFQLEAAPSDLRVKENFNSDWKFQLGDASDASKPDYNDSTWEAIGLPHSFSMPYFMASDFYTGYGWYRKSFVVPETWAGKRISLEFEAAFQDAEIFVNGEKAGTHQGGYVGFSIDLTRHVKTGRNTIAVRLNNLWKSGLAPRAGEHVFSGGIYRNVHLVATDPLHVTWCGTFVTTPKISSSSASINVKTEVRNDRATATEAELRTAILDPKGSVVSRFSGKMRIEPGATVTFDQNLPPVANPQLWDIGKPNLYHAVSQICLQGKPVDSYDTTFGIRSIQWSADKGFFLNGRRVYLEGANVHQDQAGWGDAVPDSGHRRDVSLMKEAGFNFLRGSHYPPPPARTRACDEQGMLYWAENCFWGIGGSHREGTWTASAYPINAADEKPFAESLKHSLTSMIRIHRNHPSIITWSMSNEPFFSDPQVMPKVGPLLKELVDLSRKLDPTRPAAVGGAQRPVDSTRIDKIGDIAGYNGDGATQPAFQNPGVPSIVSEYGSVTADRPGKYDPGWADLAKDQGKSVHAWRAGQAIWCGFDHGSIAGASLGKMGIVDHFRIPKRAWYWYRNEYTKVAPPEWPKDGTPAGLTLFADKSAGILTDGTDDTHLTVTVVDAKGAPLSNSPPVELSIVSGPGEFPTGPSIKFENKSDIRIQDGKAAIALRSWHAGTTVVKATSPGLKDAQLSLKFTGTDPYLEGKTPKVQPRPYVRFDKQNKVKTASTYGPNNPTFASSSAAGSASGLATDSSAGTSWKPDAADANPAIILDTEKGLSVSLIQLTFPDPQVRCYRVEVSNDRTNWTSVADLSTNTEAAASKEIRPTGGTTGRYVRVFFTKSEHAALSEIRVTGTIND